jgi:hypothetical protein
VSAVILGRAQEYGDPIERYAVTRERDHAANDLDALSTFAGRGEHLDLVVRLRLRRLVVFVKEVALEPGESAGRWTPRLASGRQLVQVFDLAAQAIAETCERRRIGSRYRRQHGRSGGGKRRHESEFSFGRDRHV